MFATDTDVVREGTENKERDEKLEDSDQCRGRLEECFLKRHCCYQKDRSLRAMRKRRR